MAAPKLPPGFVDLVTAYQTQKNCWINIIGYVVDILPASHMPNGQYQMTIRLQDRKLLDSALGVTSLSVKIFTKDESCCPNVRSPGDVVLLRQIKVTEYRAQPVFLWNFGTCGIAFDGNVIPEPDWKLRYQQGIETLVHTATPCDDASKRIPSIAEQMYAIDLKHSIKPADLARLPFSAPAPTAVVQDRAYSQTKTFDLAKRPPPDAPTGPQAKRQRTSAFGPKYRTVSQLKHFEFADLCVEVVDKYSGASDYEIKVTDYTENKNLFYRDAPEEEGEVARDGDDFGYSKPARANKSSGPYGQYCLQISLKNPHASFIDREVRVGDIVLLQNVKMKIRGNDVLTGDMWPDTLYPDRVGVRRLEKPGAMFNSYADDVATLRERGQAYWTARAPKSEETKMSKAQKKKEKGKRAKQRREAQMVQQNEDATNVDSPFASNKHVRCMHMDQPVCSLSRIQDLDSASASDGPSVAFHNLKYRARVKVVDYDPDIEDFAAPAYASQSSNQSQYYADILRDQQTQPDEYNFRWQFLLLLEDAMPNHQGREAKEQMWVVVGHQEAQYLLGNDVGDPRDLRDSPRLLAQLKAQLCALWGDLEELKSGGKDIAAVSNRPFECCLQEYDVERDKDGEEDGPVRLWRLFGTTIL